MSPTASYVRGRASGWSVFQRADGQWHWSAYGPRGANLGAAPSRPQAETLARRSAEDLGRAVTPNG